MVNDYPSAAEEARATLAFRQQKQKEDAAAEEAAKQAVGSADKANRESELKTLKDISVFVMDLLTVTGDVKAVAEYLDGEKNWKTALTAGLGVVGIKGAAGKVDELEALIKSQARDQKAWAKMGGEKPPTAVKEAYTEAGIDMAKLKPEPWRETNTAQFPAGVDKTRMYNDEFEQLDVGPKHTQAQADPSATSGLSPQLPASEGSRMENAVIFANRRAKQWNSGWDAGAMREQLETVHKSGTKEAAKGKAGGKPEFWIYDESADELIKVKRNAKTDKLEIKRVKPKENEALRQTNEAILWDRATDKPVLDASGKPTFTNVPVYNDKIDMVVPREGKKELDKMLHNLWTETLDTK